MNDETRKLRDDAEPRVTAEQAREAAMGLIDEHFHNDPKRHPTQFRIPADKSDTDLLLMRYIDQSEGRYSEGYQAGMEAAAKFIANDFCEHKLAAATAPRPTRESEMSENIEHDSAGYPHKVKNAAPAESAAAGEPTCKHARVVPIPHKGLRCLDCGCVHFGNCAPWMRPEPAGEDALRDARANFRQQLGYFKTYVSASSDVDIILEVWIVNNYAHLPSALEQKMDAALEAEVSRSASLEAQLAATQVQLHSAEALQGHLSRLACERKQQVYDLEGKVLELRGSRAAAEDALQKLATERERNGKLVEALDAFFAHREKVLELQMRGKLNEMPSNRIDEIIAKMKEARGTE